jgi:membrane-bound metal-dependent hydrolase YbcI (DUF457 family)
MAGYREHISVSGVLGAFYGVGSVLVFGFSPVQGALAGILTWVAGMLPDLDSQTGKPVREVSSLIAAVVPLVMMQHLLDWAGDTEMAVLLGVLTYALIRYGGAMLLAKVSVHRGMFHSIPALLIASEVAYLGYKHDSIYVKLLMAGGVALGFFSHLLLDEMYSVEWTGVRLKLNKAAGSALKYVGKRFVPNVITYALLALFTYAILIDIGLIQDPVNNGRTPLLQHAAEELPARQ